MQKQIIARSRVPDSHLDNDLHPVIKQIYAARGVQHTSEINNRADSLLDFNLFKDIHKACDILLHALQHQQKVLIVGDFDADGATSTAVLMQGLAMFGFNQLDYLVPNRFNLGYGLSPALAEQVVSMQPDVLITVDNGISCVQGVAICKDAGIKVIVTDHHLPGEQLPSADAIVNPNQFDCTFPSKSIAGVGVAFYLLVAFRHMLRTTGYFEAVQKSEPNIAELLDIVALGTVADVVKLDANNRTLVHQGLARIRAGRTRPGILALIEIAKRQAARLAASDFAFAIAPRLNAAGRLDDMSLGIACLLTNDPNQARRIAYELDGLNQERREIEQGMQQEAEAVLSRLALGETLPDAVCLYQDDWHQGVIGILAGRLKERYHRPTVIFAQGDHGEIKGSCRSIPGVHMRDLLESIATAQPDLILKYGGHAMAAGLSIREQDFSKFKQVFEQTASNWLTDELKSAVILTDGALPTDCFNLAFASSLKQAGPFGQGFPEPLFDNVFTLIQQRIVGEKHLKLVVENEAGMVLDAIAFNIDIKAWPNTAIERVRLIYQLDINEFRGKFSVQLLVTELLPA